MNILHVQWPIPWRKSQGPGEEPASITHKMAEDGEEVFELRRSSTGVLQRLESPNLSEETIDLLILRSEQLPRTALVTDSRLTSSNVKYCQASAMNDN